MQQRMMTYIAIFQIVYGINTKKILHLTVASIQCIYPVLRNTKNKRKMNTISYVPYAISILIFSSIFLIQMYIINLLMKVIFKKYNQKDKKKIKNKMKNKNKFVKKYK